MQLLPSLIGEGLGVRSNNYNENWHNLMFLFLFDLIPPSPFSYRRRECRKCLAARIFIMAKGHENEFSSLCASVVNP